MENRFDVLIVGGGHGGAQTAIALRGAGFEGSIAIIGDEPELPYERPPLSKEYFAAEKSFDRLLIRPAHYWEEKRVSFILGYRVVSIAPDAHHVSLSDGAVCSYGQLVWATGGDPRKLSCPGSDLDGVHAVRKRADIDAIVSELNRVQRVVVIGGGYIGLEAAAVLSKLDYDVTILEAMPRILARVAGADIANFFEAEHRSHGVTVRTGVSVTALRGEQRVTGVELSSGEILPADLVIVGIGVVPCTEPIVAAGAAGDNGVKVDAQCRTSLSDIFAIGDCAAHENRFADGAEIRLESVQNANDMANVVAKTICGQDAAYVATPWFWSNQYDLKLQTVGLSSGYGEAAVRGEPNLMAPVQAMIAFIDDNCGVHGVEPICNVLPIAPSTYHKHVAERRDPSRLSARARRDLALKPEVTRVFAENFRVYGVRKVWRQMQREGQAVARCTVGRLMRDLGLAGVIRGKPVRTTISDREHQEYAGDIFYKPHLARWITSTASSMHQHPTDYGCQTSPTSPPGAGSFMSPS